MRPLRTGPALDALDRALAGTAPRLLLAPGDPARVLAELQGAPAPAQATSIQAAPAAAAQPVGEDTYARAERLVLQIMAEELKLPEAEIAVTEPLDHYGVDSLITLSVTRRLEEHYRRCRRPCSSST
ncbi:hypothetical protein SALBM135S_01708 [Streptomyces alboniger]